MNTTKTLLSERVLSMEESATIKMAQMARDLKAQGHDVISLSLGEPDFDTPVHIKEAAKRALDAGHTKYTPVPGTMELRVAICTKLQRDNGMKFSPDQIMVSNGAKQCIANLAMAMLDKGDEVVIFAPYWVSYHAIVKMAGGVPVPIMASIEQDFKVTADQVESAITDKTKFILFSSPCNPTGSVYSKDELHQIAEVLGKHEDVYVVADEIYEYINFEGKNTSIGSFDQVKDRTITVNGFSKGFAMTGWRLGYMAGPKHVIKACSKIQGQFTSGATAFGQQAAAEALLSDLSPTYNMVKEFKKRRDMMLDLLKEIPGMKLNQPEGAFYIFPDISEFFGRTINGIAIDNSIDFCQFLLNEAHVAVVPGAAFGDENCFRISYAASEESLREAVRRMKDALA